MIDCLNNNARELFVTYQIMCNLAEVHVFRGGQDYPGRLGGAEPGPLTVPQSLPPPHHHPSRPSELFRYAINTIEVVVGADFTTMVPLACWVDADYRDTLYAVTAVPAGLFLVFTLWESALAGSWLAAWEGDAVLNGTTFM